VSDDLTQALDAETVEVAELRRANVRLQRQLAQAKAKTGALVEAVEQAARDAAVTSGRPRETRVKSDRRRRDPEVAVLHATDWQVGKRTDSYDTEIAATRIGRLAEKVARVTDVQRADHPVPSCTLLLGGDMVEGVSIFPGQAWEVDSSLYDQLFAASRIVEQLIVDLLAVFERVDVVCEYGNHGRLGRRGDHPGHDNIDLMLYRIVADRTRSPRVSWQFGPDWHQLVTVGSYRALLVHGDEVKSFGGQTPAFGIARKCNAWATGVVPGDWTDVYMGHWHQPLTVPLAHGRGRVFVSPSPESGNTYAAEFVAATGTPGQRLNFVDPAAGRVSGEYLLWLDQ
jgi:hypothetical protein